MKTFLNALSMWIIPIITIVILLHGLFKKVSPYETFVEGAKEGISIGFKIIPYLVAIMVAVSMFRASGAIDFLAEILKAPLEFFKVPIETLPLMITRSMSGSATLGIFSDIVTSGEVNSSAAKVSAVIVGSYDTTLYVLAVYFGAVGIKKIKYALLVGLLADAFGIVAAIFVCRYFFA